MLTALKIKTAKPAERAYKLDDAGGLFLLVQPNGSKLWRYKFRLQGVGGLQALGAFPEVGLADARAAHSTSRQLVSSGINPVQARRAERESRAISSMRRTKGSFEALCVDWDAATSAALRPATAGQRRREIDKDLLLPFLGRPIASITRLELTTTLKAVDEDEFSHLSPAPTGSLLVGRKFATPRVVCRSLRWSCHRQAPHDTLFAIVRQPDGGTPLQPLFHKLGFTVGAGLAVVD